MEFKPGFRLSLMDAAVIVLGIAGGLFLARLDPLFGFLVGFVVGHFFLFCNVFRISRPPELIWAAVFTALSGATLVTGLPGWNATIGTSILIAILAILRETGAPSYHGIFWRHFNPDLETRWKSRDEESGS